MIKYQPKEVGVRFKAVLGVLTFLIIVGACWLYAWPYVWGYVHHENILTTSEPVRSDSITLTMDGTAYEIMSVSGNVAITNAGVLTMGVLTK